MAHVDDMKPRPWDEPQPKTIRVRIAVAVGNLGPWDFESYTVDERGDDHARAGAADRLKHARYMRRVAVRAPIEVHFTEATIPLPESVTAEGEVGK